MLRLQLLQRLRWRARPGLALALTLGLAWDLCLNLGWLWRGAQPDDVPQPVDELSGAGCGLGVCLH